MKSRFGNEHVFFTITHGWDENSIKYDANGNVQARRRDSSVQGTLTANSGILIDQLKYTYSSSIPDQLYTVYDSSGSAKGFIGGATASHYTYDANGNLTNEPYQGITGITYNVLNRTDSTKLSGTTYITYTYNAAGILLRKKAYNSGTLTQTDYIGGFVYTGNGTTQTLQYAPMPEGRLLGTALTQEYVITDPQGNARVAFQNVSGVAKVTQENSYYGYGLLMPGSVVGWSAPPNKNLYNGGSEWQNDTKAVNAGVPDYYQTYYRNYDPALARWVAVDPMAESLESMSVFQYSGDNPIMMNDPGGDKSAAPGSQYVDQDNALQEAFQNMYQGSISGGGPDPVNTMIAQAKYNNALADFWDTALSISMQIMNQLPNSPYGVSLSGTELESDVGSVQTLSDSQSITIDVRVALYTAATNPQGNPGVHIVVGFTLISGSVSNFVGYNAISSFSVNGSAWQIDNKGNANNLYYNSGDATDVSSLLAIAAQGGNNYLTVFTDWPGTTAGNRQYTFQTTLVGVTSSGTIIPLASFQWGYNTNSNDVSSPLGPSPTMLQGTPSNNQTYINRYNNSVTPTTTTPYVP